MTYYEMFAPMREGLAQVGHSLLQGLALSIVLTTILFACATVHRWFKEAEKAEQRIIEEATAKTTKQSENHLAEAFNTPTQNPEDRYTKAAREELRNYLR